MNIFLDSDIVIEVLRSRDQAILSEWDALANTDGEILFSPITAAEIWAGARPHEYADISNFFLPLTCLPISHEVGETAGQFMRRYRKSHSLEVPDAIIAASAVVTEGRLWTLNRKHFPMPELSLY